MASGRKTPLFYPILPSGVRPESIHDEDLMIRFMNNDSVIADAPNCQKVP
jgi:hypothetical protein